MFDYVNIGKSPTKVFPTFQHVCTRDGKSVKNSTDANFQQKNSTKNAYFATYCNLRQNNVLAVSTVVLALC